MAAPIPHFRDSVQRIFKGWTALQLAVEHGFGGQDSAGKASWLVEAIDQWFKENENLEFYEVEDFLAEILTSEFDTVADDGSLTQVSKMICKCYELVRQGKEAELAAVLSSLPQSSGTQQCVPNSASSLDSDSDSEPDQDTDMDVSEGPSTSQSGGNFSAAPTQECAMGGSTEADSSRSAQNVPGDGSTSMEEDDGWKLVKKGKKR